MSIKHFIEKKFMNEKTINLKDISYIGIFFDKQEIFNLAANYGDKLDKIIENPHITLSYRPNQEQLQQLYNFMKENPAITIKANITSYGNDGKNEGFYVSDISSFNNKEIPYFGANKKHITISVSNDSSPVQTGFMDFNQPINPIEITGRVGIFMKDKTINYPPINIETEKLKENNMEMQEAR